MCFKNWICVIYKILIANNEVKTDGIKYICQALKENQTLISINICIDICNGNS